MNKQGMQASDCLHAFFVFIVTTALLTNVLWCVCQQSCLYFVRVIRSDEKRMTISPINAWR
ncbi:hypothetical protein HMPREF6745_0199 [Prevotella sp. oral taxon 472 str. F0295]|nr:hypothetical protein HMPREF6745_0199 [Prevotella sp. oral taxon 472 str. F0295]